MPSLVEELKAVKARIANKKNWCIGWYARDKHGDRVHAESPAACQWCIHGAILREDRGFSSVESIICQVGVRLYGKNLTIINDEFGFRAVHRVLNTAIKEAEAEEKANVET